MYNSNEEKLFVNELMKLCKKYKVVIHPELKHHNFDYYSACNTTFASIQLRNYENKELELEEEVERMKNRLLGYTTIYRCDQHHEEKGDIKESVRKIASDK